MRETITLPNGIVLDPNGGWASLLQQHIERAGLPQMRAYLATHPGGYQEYLLVHGTTPGYTSTSFEAVSAHIDMLAAEQRFREAALQTIGIDTETPDQKEVPDA